MNALALIDTTTTLITGPESFGVGLGKQGTNA
jgi:hypothetical protein